MSVGFADRPCLLPGAHDRFVEGEGLAEPLQAYAIDIGDAAQDATQEGRDIDSLGVMAAFDSAQTYSTQADSAQA